MAYYVFKLYIAGQTVRSQQVAHALQRLCNERLKQDFSLEVIDVLENPFIAEEKNILATPTLVCEMPEPPRRIIGDLSDIDKVVSLLKLDF